MIKKLLYLAMALAVVACEKNPEGGSSTPKDRNLTGFAQKGQFVKGSQVTAFAVGSDLVATGESFPANISDDLGAFGITSKIAAPYFDLRAEGYYFNEMEGTVSTSPLYLEAFVKADDTKANINLLTTAIRPRVKKLIKDGKSYNDAVSQAQKELLDAIGFTGSVGNFDDMDITGTTDADGMLLAFACMVQSGRSAAEVTTFVQEIASDLESKGALAPTTVDGITAKATNINPFTVIENLAKYYKEKSLSVNAVPPFWRHISPSYDAPLLEEEYSVNYINEINLPISESIGDVEGLGISKYYMWNVFTNYTNVYFGANFKDYIGHNTGDLIMIRPRNGLNYDSFIFSNYFSTVVDGVFAPTMNTLNIIDLISKLPINVTLNDEEQIVNARKEYNNLTSEEQKSLVSNYEDLVRAESTLEYLKSRDSGSDEPVDPVNPNEPSPFLVFMKNNMWGFITSGVLIIIFTVVLIFVTKKRKIA